MESEKKTYGYRERDELNLEELEERLKGKLPHQIAYVDAAGIARPDDYPYGNCEVGQRLCALKSGKRTQRVSWIAALKAKSLFAPMTFAGSCNRDLFEMWLEACFVSPLKPADVIVIDNPSFHHSQRIQAIVVQAGCAIWYLPAYSPVLHTIEHWWSVLKNWRRQRWDAFDNFCACVDAAFQQCPNVFA